MKELYRDESSQKIRELIIQVGKYQGAKEIQETLGISRSQIGYMGINLTKINRELGFHRRPSVSMKNPIIKREEVISKIENAIRSRQKYTTAYDLREFKVHSCWLSHFKIDVHQLNLDMGCTRKSVQEKISETDLKGKILEYISSSPSYVTQQEVILKFKVSLSYLTKSNIDTIALNREVGHRYKMNYFENLTEKVLMELQLEYSPQKWFKDLVSNATRKTHLRFDFYIPSFNLAIECNGSQHWDRNHIYFRESLLENDLLKKQYCKDNGITLLEIPFIGRWDTTLEYIKSKILETLGKLSATTQSEKIIVNAKKERD